MKIVIATRNRHKAMEIELLFSNLGIDIVCLDSLDPVGKIPEIEETGKTLKENALIKSRTIFELTGFPSISDDTGLEVKSLDGEPGVYSARYAGEGCSYDDNIKKLLKNMDLMENDQRNANFRTVTSFFDGTVELYAEGVVKGKITKAPKGLGGFGYDPVFLPKNMEKTYAELSKEEKNKLSHRGKAFSNLIKKLKKNNIISNNLSNI
ncbi:MAG: non-canonical purine NTP pyrophosphatase, RdgB/HAM1 family [Candidatus Marinimicrobia bacterium]|nr:non-canonical purine NTP pyrophosphatase, RdgB/HAM1 family [Candidatus Neomarinimicrobiota bacterium]|tara:strand:- start:6174 stop:6797 length:624 start_codon:yes stop_codon:yes gene_type:complete